MMPDAIMVNIVIKFMGLYANTQPLNITHSDTRHIILNVVNFLLAIGLQQFKSDLLYKLRIIMQLTNVHNICVIPKLFGI